VNEVKPTALEALPADVAAKAIECGLGDRTVTCIGRRPWVDPRYLLQAAIFGAVSIWFASSLVETAMSDESGWLYLIDMSWKSVVVASSLWLAHYSIDPRLRRLRIYGFAGGIIHRDHRMRLTVLSWDEITRVARQRSREVPETFYSIAPPEGRGIRVVPSRYSHWTEFMELLRREVQARGRRISGE
jgi:hypothetical protein